MTTDEKTDAVRIRLGVIDVAESGECGILVHMKCLYACPGSVDRARTALGYHAGYAMALIRGACVDHIINIEG